MNQGASHQLKPRIWGAQSDARLAELAAAGHSVAEIAEAMERTPNGIYARLRILGLRLATDRKPQVHVTADDEVRILALLAQGMTQSAVAAQLDISPSAARNILRRKDAPAQGLKAAQGAWNAVSAPRAAPQLRHQAPSDAEIAMLDAELCDLAPNLRSRAVKEAAERWGIAVSTVYDRIHRKRTGHRPRIADGDTLWALWTRAEAAVARRARTASAVSA